METQWLKGQGHKDVMPALGHVDRMVKGYDKCEHWCFHSCLIFVNIYQHKRKFYKYNFKW